MFPVGILFGRAETCFRYLRSPNFAIRRSAAFLALPAVEHVALLRPSSHSRGRHEMKSGIQLARQRLPDRRGIRSRWSILQITRKDCTIKGRNETSSSLTWG